ncbi:ribosome hibernation-promoting factor, HPF/YfiA family [Tessaracoccus sp. ZS01]|uniref:ribosome hibernation-promoting factor, HPF/YfiA family n=1 Tax=Tessaracoccus sp. ZS01 TaxID=1906324 RepID=UPI00096F3B3B|nr:ribosome-associated translation inhibitor RaiA [Tessaracoccus sp. ZS01]MCG6566415.1 ribosome-associated translation inhibitor RaiA [Tessaracoccus sp. ZS01]OMG58873.1 ribosomal subunit interface protein [Tessaracoccus sp. ZS01]
MDIVVTGRQCTISPEVKELVSERLATIERLRDRVIRVEVEFQASEGTKNPSDATTVQLTLRSRGPVIRAEANAEDKTAAFEIALDRLKSQLRRAADRRKTHRGLRAGAVPEFAPAPEPTEEKEQGVPVTNVAGLVVTGDGPLVVREKVFETAPLTLAQALDEMELVGHDFFLYQDAESGRPSVVYRRKAYNYGVIQLDVS